MSASQFLPPAALAVFLTACTQAPPAAPPDPRPAAEKAIRDTEAAWNRAWTTGDAAKIAPYWSDDATLMMTNVPPIHGRAEIQKGLKDMLDNAGLKLQFAADKVEVGLSGDIAYTQGHYEQQMMDPKSKKIMIEKGKYLTVYRKQADGTWQAIEDINNADAPAAIGK